MTKQTKKIEVANEMSQEKEVIFSWRADEEVKVGKNHDPFAARRRIMGNVAPEAYAPKC